MTKIIAITNQKGGVGKTTTAVNLSAALVGKKGNPVLLVDLDPQGNATTGSGIHKHELQVSAYEVLIEQLPVQQAIISTPEAGYDLLPANGDLTAAEVQLLEVDKKEQRLKQALAQVSPNYQFIIIDCPPALNMLTINSLVASDSVIIPMQCEYYALEGLSALITTIEKIKATFNDKLTIEGLLRTMHDPRSRLTQEVSAQLLEHFGKTVYRTTIPRNVRLAEAPSHGMPAVLYAKRSRGALAYNKLAKEVRRKLTTAMKQLTLV
jgi:chromosome partitioning protein